MRLAAAALFLLSMSNANADSWASAQPIAAVSDDTNWLVRVVPGESIGDVYGFAGEPTGPYAEATLFQYDEVMKDYSEIRKFRTQNPVSPVEIFVTNEGWLITLDNWHNFGIGNVLTVSNSNGKVVRTFTLADIFSAEDLEKLEMSMSSIWWRCGPAILGTPEKTVGVWDSLGRVLSIGYVDGAINVVDESDRCVDDDT